MKWSSFASEKPSLEEALGECAAKVKGELGSDTVDLAVVFVSPHYRDGYDQIPQLIAEGLAPKRLIGCSAGGVIGGGHEIEQRAGVSLTAAVMPNVEAIPFHLENDSLPDLDASPGSWESIIGTTRENKPQFLLITDPFTIRSDNLLLGLDYAFSGSVKVGGMASGGQGPGANALILDDRVHTSGAVGLAFHGDIVIDTIVAQGCRPVDKPMKVTRCKSQRIAGVGRRTGTSGASGPLRVSRG